MGHYDSCYDAEHERLTKDRNQKIDELIPLVEKLVIEVKGTSIVKIPTRFLDSLEDFRNWLVCKRDS